MDIQSERRRLLDADGGDEDPTGLMSEEDAYLRSVNTLTHQLSVAAVSILHNQLEEQLMEI